MNIGQKNLWDLSVEEIEYVYSNLHMNNYVYAGLMTYHQSRMPLNRVVRLRKEKIPECLHEEAQRLIELSPYLGNGDSRTVRINYTYYAFQLFSRLKHIKIEEIEDTLEFLASLAYIPIVAEKNDNLLLWLSSVVRRKNKEVIRAFNSIKEDMDLADFIKIPLWNNDKGIEDDEIEKTPSLLLYYFMPRAVQSVLIMLENNVDRELAASAFRNIEKNMLRYERENDLGDRRKYRHLGNVKYPSNIRYRNTLYLYGGNLFERMGRMDEAFSWYAKDIYIMNLPNNFWFYLTSLKTCERLLCAYRVHRADKEAVLFKDLINHCMLKALNSSSSHAVKVLRYIASNPKADLSAIRFYVNEEKTHDILYAGEASREIFISALLYNRIINNVDYHNIDYDKFFSF